MAALSAFAHSTGTKALLFYNTTESTLALEVRNATPVSNEETDTAIATYENTDVQATGNINNPTSLAALYLDGADTTLIGVYGIIKTTAEKKCTCQASCSGTTTTTSDYGRLCLLSPAFMPLEDSSQSEKANVKYGRLAGVQAPGVAGAGWLYFRSTTSTSKISILDIGTKVVTEVSNAESPADDTFLAAYYDADKSERHLLYQKSSSGDSAKIFDFKDTTNGSSLDGVGLNNAHFPAGIAAVWVDSKVYLYYVAVHSKTYQLRKKVKSGGVWGADEKLNTDSDLQSTTQLTATALTDKNYIAYVNSDGAVETFEDARSAK